jgi:hypothetical protein
MVSRIKEKQGPDGANGLVDSAMAIPPRPASIEFPICHSGDGARA